MQVAELEKKVSDALSIVTVAIGFAREHLEDLEYRVQIIEYPDCTAEEDCSAEAHRVWCASQQETEEEPSETEDE